jgi:hypothetical protein
MATLTLRTVKGDALTYLELDSNFLALDSDIQRINDLQNIVDSGSGVTVSGSVTATSFIGDGSGLTGVTSYVKADFDSDLKSSVGPGLQYIDATNLLQVDSAGIVTLSSPQTITNKTISGSNNTLSNIANSSLTNSSITINGTSVSLGGTRTLVTDDISEDGSPVNLWYTTTRANSDIDARVTKTFVDNLNVDADTLDGQDGTYYRLAVYDRTGSLLN